MIPSFHVARGTVLRLAAGAILSLTLPGCATVELNTKASTDLPIRTPGLRVVYAVSKLKSPFLASGDSQQLRRDRIVEMLRTSVESRLPASLADAGIQSTFVAVRAGELVKWDAVPSAEGKTDWPILRVEPNEDIQTCNRFACSHQLRVHLSITSAEGKPPMWSSEVQEPTLVSSFTYQARYDGLADHISKAALRAVAPAIGK